MGYADHSAEYISKVLPPKKYHIITELIEKHYNNEKLLETKTPVIEETKTYENLSDEEESGEIDAKKEREAAKKNMQEKASIDERLLAMQKGKEVRLEQEGKPYFQESDAFDYQEKIQVIKVESAGYDAGNYAKITINDVPVNILPNESGHRRGLNIVIIDPSTGNVELSQCFDTYKTSEKLNGLIEL